MFISSLWIPSSASAAYSVFQKSLVMRIGGKVQIESLGTDIFRGVRFTTWKKGAILNTFVQFFFIALNQWRWGFYWILNAPGGLGSVLSNFPVIGLDVIPPDFTVKFMVPSLKFEKSILLIDQLPFSSALTFPNELLFANTSTSLFVLEVPSIEKD